MSDNLVERMNDLHVRTEYTADKKAYECEIDSLEAKLGNLESNYERLKTTYKSNLENLAMMQVDLNVAKEIHTFAQDMMNKKRESVVLEKRKLNDLHLKMWEEKRKACDELDKCITENDSVNFLNNYTAASEIQKYESLAERESDSEIKNVVNVNTEIKQLAAEVTLLEKQINCIENSCLSHELRNLLTEIEKLDDDDNYKAVEIQRLMEALDRFHSERLALEDEIREIESCEPVVPSAIFSLERSQQDVKYVSGVKKEEKFIKIEVQIREHNSSQVNKKQDKKMKAKEWYEEYARGIAVPDEEVYLNNFYALSSKSKIEDHTENSDNLDSHEEQLNSARKDKYEEGEGEFFKLPPVITKQRCGLGAKRKSEMQFEKSVESRFFRNRIKNSKHEAESLAKRKTDRVKLKNEKDDVAAVKPMRKSEPLMASPYSFINYRAIEQSATSQSIPKVTERVKFTPKRPSNVRKMSQYRQKKLDDFLQFMLSDN